MAEFIHGIKPEFGPKHNHEEPGNLCVQGCETCARRIFDLHMSFFQDEFRKNAIKQHGVDKVCQDPSCKDCHVAEITCPGKDCKERHTGLIRTGVPGCEIFQKHPSNLSCCSQLGPAPVKRCCTIHIRSWLVCSMECLKRSNFVAAIPAGDLFEFEALFDQKVFAIPPMGAMLCTGHYRGPQISENLKKSSCASCSRLGATKSCAACRQVKYCDQVCQRHHWQAHRSDCKPTSTEPSKPKAAIQSRLKTAQPATVETTAAAAIDVKGNDMEALE